MKFAIYYPTFNYQNLGNTLHLCSSKLADFAFGKIEESAGYLFKLDFESLSNWKKRLRNQRLLKFGIHHFKENIVLPLFLFIKIVKCG